MTPGRSSIALALAVAASGCMPVVVPVQGDRGPEVGPELVLDVLNQSDRELTVGYEFESVASSGGGEGLVAACERVTLLFGTIAGSYDIRLDGEPVFDGRMAAGLPADGFFVVRLAVDADGVGSVTEPGWTRIPPEMANRPLRGCD